MRRDASREPRSLTNFLLPLVVAAAVVATTPDAFGYLKLGTRVGSRTVNLEVGRFPDPLLRHRAGDDGRDRAAVPDRDLDVVRRMGRRRHSRSLRGVRRVHRRESALRRQHDRDRLSEPARPRSRAGGDQLHHRYAVRRSDRVRHLLQHFLPVVDRCCRRVGTPRRAVDRRPRDRPSARSRPLRPRRNRGRPRRTARARRGSRHVSDRLRRRQHPRSRAQGR